MSASTAPPPDPHVNHTSDIQTLKAHNGTEYKLLRQDKYETIKGSIKWWKEDSSSRASVVCAHRIFFLLSLSVAHDSGIEINGWRIERFKGSISNSVELDESDNNNNSAIAVGSHPSISILTFAHIICSWPFICTTGFNLAPQFTVLRWVSCRIIWHCVISSQASRFSLKRRRH